jgi:hypothetical protein
MSGREGDAMSNVGVFGWIRESVRRAVLLGFSDAVEQLGTPADAQEGLHPQLAAVLGQSTPRILERENARGTGKPDRKRLGRSLDQFRTPPGSAGGRSEAA